MTYQNDDDDRHEQVNKWKGANDAQEKWLKLKF